MAYREMVNNILMPLVKADTEIVRLVVSLFLFLFSFIYIMISQVHIVTISPRSRDPFSIVTYCIKWVTTSWTDGTRYGRLKHPKPDMPCRCSN